MKYIRLFCLFLLFGCSKNNSIVEDSQIDCQLDSILTNYKNAYIEEEIRRNPWTGDDEEFLPQTFYYTIMLYQWDNRNRMAVWGSDCSPCAFQELLIYYAPLGNDSIFICQSTKCFPDSIMSQLFSGFDLKSGQDYDLPMMCFDLTEKIYEYENSQWVLLGNKSEGDWYKAKKKEQFNDYSIRFDSIVNVISKQNNASGINSAVNELFWSEPYYFEQIIHSYPEVETKLINELVNPEKSM